MMAKSCLRNTLPPGISSMPTILGWQVRRASPARRTTRRFPNAPAPRPVCETRCRSGFRRCARSPAGQAEQRSQRDRHVTFPDCDNAAPRPAGNESGGSGSTRGIVRTGERCCMPKTAILRAPPGGSCQRVRGTPACTAMLWSHGSATPGRRDDGPGGERARTSQLSFLAKPQRSKRPESRHGQPEPPARPLAA